MVALWQISDLHACFSRFYNCHLNNFLTIAFKITFSPLDGATRSCRLINSKLFEALKSVSRTLKTKN